MQGGKKPKKYLTKNREHKILKNIQLYLNFINHFFA